MASVGEEGLMNVVSLIACFNMPFGGVWVEMAKLMLLL